MVRNPMNPNMIRRVSLEPEYVDCIVFWSKNPAPLLEKLDRLKLYHYYFLFTITCCGHDLEKNLPAKDTIIETFKELSKKIGSARVIWRYDPILLTDKIDCRYHYKYFDYIAAQLESFTGRCIISFLDMYDKCKRNLAGFAVRLPDRREMLEIAGKLNSIAQKRHIELQTCAESHDFSAAGVLPGKCIDDRLIAKITGRNIDIPGDKYQRKTCRCVESVDIGAYDTCRHNCLYCYANSNRKAVERNAALHNPHSPFLLSREKQPLIPGAAVQDAASPAANL